MADLTSWELVRVSHFGESMVLRFNVSHSIELQIVKSISAVRHANLHERKGFDAFNVLCFRVIGARSLQKDLSASAIGPANLQES